jgi:phosphoglycolate phosphatase
MSVLSNKPDMLVQLIAGQFFADWDFIRIQGQIDGIARKPDPEVPLSIAAQMGAEPGEVVFLGDSDIDMLTAVAAGMIPVGAGWGFRGEEELAGAGARLVLHKPSQLLALLEAEHDLWSPGN